MTPVFFFDCVAIDADLRRLTEWDGPLGRICWGPQTKMKKKNSIDVVISYVYIFFIFTERQHITLAVEHILSPLNCL